MYEYFQMYLPTKWRNFRSKLLDYQRHGNAFSQFGRWFHQLWNWFRLQVKGSTRGISGRHLTCGCYIFVPSEMFKISFRLRLFQIIKCSKFLIILLLFFLYNFLIKIISQQGSVVRPVINNISPILRSVISSTRISTVSFSIRVKPLCWNIKRMNVGHQYSGHVESKVRNRYD